MKTKIESFLDKFLEEYTFEEILEMFNVTPHEAFELLYEEGLIDEDLLEEYL